MSVKKYLCTPFFFVAWFYSFGQHTGLTFQDAEKKEITIQHLDSIYKSAVHVDTSLAVFKTEKEQEAMGMSYMKLLQDFGKFLSDHNYKWKKPTMCFNRIYFLTSALGHLEQIEI